MTAVPLLLNLVDIPVPTRGALVWHAELHCCGTASAQCWDTAWDRYPGEEVPGL